MLFVEDTSSQSMPDRSKPAIAMHASQVAQNGSVHSVTELQSVPAAVVHDTKRTQAVIDPNLPITPPMAVFTARQSCQLPLLMHSSAESSPRRIVGGYWPPL